LSVCCDRPGGSFPMLSRFGPLHRSMQAHEGDGPGQGPPQAQPSHPFVSVIVPVYDDVRLAACLRALAGQTYPADRYEIIVIDNGSMAPLSFGALSGKVAVHREPAPGSYAARNRGIKEARGEVLAFTDADCIPDSNWLMAGMDRLSRDDRPDMVGGDVRIFPKDPANLTAAELFECVWSFPQRQFVEEKHFAATANLLAHRWVFETVGPFNAQMMSGGDVEWGHRAHRAGKTLVFSQDALVHHPARRSVRELAEKYRRTCGGRYQLRCLHGEGHRQTLMKLIKRPMKALIADNCLDSPVQRARYAGVELLLSTVQILELVRLACGGRPRRR
jgi:GT2 family glycosyltransferase